VTYSVTTKSARGTRSLGKHLGALLESGDVVGLHGDLGAGKTTFVQGLAEGLSVPGGAHVRSPTFTVANTYEGGRVRLHHLDFYRLHDHDSLLELGYEDFLGGDAACVIEWIDQIPEASPRDYLRVELRDAPDIGVNARMIELRASGPRSSALVAAMQKKKARSTE